MRIHVIFFSVFIHYIDLFMGASGSREEDEGDSVFDTTYISWDENGNLRYGLVHPVTRQKQLQEIIELDHVDDERGKSWYIMDSAWIESWLAYVNVNKGIAPCPGRCNNNRLVVYDYQLQKYVKRQKLIMAVKDRAGDYRRVSEEVWHKFKEYYPDSGPAIAMTFTENDSSPEACEWTVVDFIDPPPDLDKKKKKLRIPKFLAKKEKDSEKENSKNGQNIDITDKSVGGNGVIDNEAKLTNDGPVIEYGKITVIDEQRPISSTSGGTSTKNESYFEDVYFSKEK